MAFPDDWGRRQKLTIDVTSLSLSGSVSDFSLPITEAWFDSDIFSYTDNGGGDVRFSSDEAGTTQLPLDLISFDTSSNTCELYIPPSTLSTTTTAIYAWYDKTGESQPSASDTYGSQNAWDANFTGVWHLGGLTDSTDTGATLTNNNSATFASAKLGNGVDLERSSSQSLSRADDNTFDVGTGSVTISCWAKIESTSIYGGIFSKITSNDQSGYRLDVNNDQSISFWIKGGGVGDHAKTAASAIATSGFYHVWAERNGTNTLVYVNNSTTASDSDSGQNLDTTDGINIGAYRSGASTSNLFDGIIDEMRISVGTARGADWRSLEYNLVNDPTTYVTASDVTVIGGGTAVQDILGSGIVPFAR